MSCWSISVVLYQFTGLSMWMMFILSFVASQSPVSTVSVASIFDVTSPSEKSSVIGRRSALSSIGGFIGLGVSYALNDDQASAACLVCMCLSIVVHGFFWPETLPSSRRVPFSCGSVNPLKPLVFFFQSRPYRYLFFVMLVEQLAGSGYNALIFNYAVKTFHVSQSLFVAVLATFMLGSTLVPGLLLPLLKQKFGMSDTRLIVFGLIGMASSFGVIAFIPDLVCFFAASATLGLGGLIAPAASSIVSSRIPDSVLPKVPFLPFSPYPQCWHRSLLTPCSSSATHRSTIQASRLFSRSAFASLLSFAPSSFSASSLMKSLIQKKVIIQNR